MSTEFNADVEGADMDADSSRDVEFDDPPSPELGRALLSLALFGALILFGIGCMVFGWN